MEKRVTISGKSYAELEKVETALRKKGFQTNVAPGEVFIFGTVGGVTNQLKALSIQGITVTQNNTRPYPTTEE